MAIQEIVRGATGARRQGIRDKASYAYESEKYLARALQKCNVYENPTARERTHRDKAEAQKGKRKG